MWRKWFASAIYRLANVEKLLSLKLINDVVSIKFSVKFRVLVKKLYAMIAYIFHLWTEQGMFFLIGSGVQNVSLHKNMVHIFQCEDYQTLLILHVLSKVFEMLVYIELYRFLESIAFLCDSQVCFPKKIIRHICCFTVNYARIPKNSLLKIWQNSCFSWIIWLRTLNT